MLNNKFDRVDVRRHVNEQIKVIEDNIQIKNADGVKYYLHTLPLIYFSTNDNDEEICLEVALEILKEFESRGFKVKFIEKIAKGGEKIRYINLNWEKQMDRDRLASVNSELKKYALRVPST